MARSTWWVRFLGETYEYFDYAFGEQAAPLFPRIALGLFVRQPCVSRSGGGIISLQPYLFSQWWY
jgi:hypothetical protein